MSDYSLPLTPQQWETLVTLLSALTPAQRQWVSGFVAGWGALSQEPVPSPPPPLPANVSAGMTLLFGSQTGNAEKLARGFHERLTEAGITVKLESMANYKPAQLKREHDLLVVVSTQGEGDPPDNALGLHRFLHSGKAPRLEHLRYAVLALGDSSYEHFCKTGVDFDERLSALGAEPITERVDCDVDYEDVAEAWIEKILDELSLAPSASTSTTSEAGTAIPASQYSKKHPFPARLLENLPLTAPGSTKDVRHIALSLEESGLRYTPGDALGVVPSNWPERVEQLLEVLNLYHADTVTSASGASSSLEKVLLNDYEITTVSRPFLEKYASLTESAELHALLKPDHRQQLQEWLFGREIIDVIRQFPVRGLSAQEFIGLLRKLPPRLYSIASSWTADPDEVHLTVAVVRFESHSLSRNGVASTFLADRVEEGGTVPVYVHENPNFRLPRDSSTPIIMIGPGTGVAPFRAFLSEREALGAAGRNWLFFGDRNFETDFLYQNEWLDYRRKGLLTRIDVAFSRDGAEKVYVQHRIRQQARALYAWLQEGAHVYVCGDATQMAPDVQTALLEVIAQEGGKYPEQAQEYLHELQATKRYQRDVY